MMFDNANAQQTLSLTQQQFIVKEQKQAFSEMFSKSNFLAKGTQSMTVLKKDLITYGFNGFLKTLENSHETTIPMRGGIFSQYRFEL